MITIRLAVARIEYHSSGEREELPANPYASTDPAPPFAAASAEAAAGVAALGAIMLDGGQTLFRRYRGLQLAVFS